MQIHLRRNFKRKSPDTHAPGGGVSSLAIILLDSGSPRLRIWRRIFAKAIRIRPEKIKMVAEKTPNNTAKSWNNIPPLFGSIYILAPLNKYRERSVKLPTIFSKKVYPFRVPSPCTKTARRYS